MVLYTIGYRGLNIANFLKLCGRNRLNIVDVRSYPHSKFFPDYNREELEQSLNKIGLQYRNYEPFGLVGPTNCSTRMGSLTLQKPPKMRLLWTALTS